MSIFTRGFAIPVLALGLLAMPAPAAAPDKYLLDDAQVIVTVNVRQILGSAFISSDIDKLREELQNREEIQSELNALGIDPFKDIDTVTVAAASSRGTDRMLMIIHGRFQLDKLNARAPLAVKEHGDNLSEVTENGHSFYEITLPEQSQSIYVAWPDSDTIVASPSRELVAEAFDVKAGKHDGSLNQDLADLFERAQGEHAVSLAVLGSGLDKLPQGAQVRSVTGGFDLDESIKLEAAIAVKDVTAAEELTKTVTDGIAQAKTMLSLMANDRKELAAVISLIEAVKVNREGDIVHLAGEISRDLLDKLKQAASDSK